jgi:flagellar protein FliS
MASTPRDAYLEAEVRTATPQRLRLMLIDGALRHARQSLAVWDDPQQRAVRYESLVRCREIVHELYATIRTDECAVAEAVKAIYRFLFQQLAAASLSDDVHKVRDVIGVLEEERETWRRLCAQMPDAPRRESTALGVGREITARDQAPRPALGQDLPAPRFSFEA